MASLVQPWRWNSPLAIADSVTPRERFRAARAAAAAIGASAQELSPQPNLPCDGCDGRGWTVCSFCNGQKTNVQVRKSRFYRRCPSCKAVGAMLCSQCRVFRCITFPDESDGSLQ